MIVSHTHRFIFFAVPRTATHSVRAALEPTLGPNDWQQERLESAKRLPIPELAAAGHGHVGVRALRPHLDEAQWRRYYKFAFVRHPYDRFVSACAFLNRDNDEFAADPVAWMLAALDRPRFQRRLLVQPQSQMLVDEDGALALTFLGRYEHLERGLSNVAQRLNLGALSLPRRNASAREATCRYLTPALRARLDERYASDFRLLGFRPSTGR